MNFSTKNRWILARKFKYLQLVNICWVLLMLFFVEEGRIVVVMTSICNVVFIVSVLRVYQHPAESLRRRRIDVLQLVHICNMYKTHMVGAQGSIYLIAWKHYFLNCNKKSTNCTGKCVFDAKSCVLYSFMSTAKCKNFFEAICH